jgi:endonuclease/exonuclease/phosphatase (EEP) superfamily protein YafD
VVSGDFNFTGHTWQADSLLALGFADAHQQAGTGRGATWPVIGLARYLPGIQLDHVFLRGGVACRGLSLGVGQNSDHRPLTATLALVTLDGNNSSPATATPTFPGYR